MVETTKLPCRGRGASSLAFMKSELTAEFSFDRNEKGQVEDPNTRGCRQLLLAGRATPRGCGTRTALLVWPITTSCGTGFARYAALDCC
jgi:hypothetical protein